MIRLRESGRGFKPGSVFGKWTVLGWQFSLGEHGKSISWYFVARCECGSIGIVRTDHARAGRSNSCRRCINEGLKHAHPRPRCDDPSNGRGSILYRRWLHIRARCYLPSMKQYKDYGGRGIRVCQEWRESFAAFEKWAMSNGYEDSKVIDRIDNDGNYEPGNCRFVTTKQSNRNTRRNHWVEAFGERKCIADWVDDPRCSVGRPIIRKRLKLQWSAEDAISLPAGVKPVSLDA